jgi:hypothetical protein
MSLSQIPTGRCLEVAKLPESMQPSRFIQICRSTQLMYNMHDNIVHVTLINIRHSKKIAERDSL